MPELAALKAAKHLHEPWRAPPAALAAANVELGVNYPHRIVPGGDLKAARAVTVAALLRTRAGALEFNDSGGYDVVELPGGEKTRVFTKQEFRLTATGKPKPPPPPRRDRKGAGGSSGHGGGSSSRNKAKGSSGGGGQGSGKEEKSQKSKKKKKKRPSPAHSADNDRGQKKLTAFFTR